MSFYRQDDCENWPWDKNAEFVPSKPCRETDILGGVYTNKPDELEKGRIMKLIIDIDENLYTRLFDNCEDDEPTLSKRDSIALETTVREGEHAINIFPAELLSKIKHIVLDNNLYDEQKIYKLRDLLDNRSEKDELAQLCAVCVHREVCWFKDNPDKGVSRLCKHYSWKEGNDETDN